MEKGHIIDDRYIILKEIGAGGFATVYKGWAIRLEKYIALKTIHDNHYRNPEFVKMFHDEVSITANLDHVNIVRILDSHGNYLIMEYVSGTDLRYLIKKSRELNKLIPPDISAYIISEVLKGLYYAQSAKDMHSGKPLNIVHRDISPANIMIYYDGKVKLTDFGIAKAASRHVEETMTGIIKGKIAYMSPEQASGKFDLDGKSDIFAVGIILYELLSGRKLFEGDSEFEILQKVVNVCPEIINIDDVSAPVELKKIVLKSLERDRKNRYQTAYNMFTDLQMFLDENKYEHGQEELEKYINAMFNNEIKSYADEMREESIFISEWCKRQEEKTAIQKKVQPVQAEEVTTIEKKKEIADNLIKGQVPKVTYKKSLMTLAGLFVIISLGIGGYYLLQSSKQKPATPQNKPQEVNPVSTVGMNNTGTVAELKSKSTIKSVPAGADVYIDDDHKGVTPLEFELKLGKHNIKIEKSNYESYNQTVDISDIKQPVSVESKLKKIIQFTCYDKNNPSEDINALINIEGTDIKNKKTPFTVALLPGEYKVAFNKKPAYEEKSWTVEVKNQNEIKQYLETQLPELTVVAKDKSSGQPISDAYILLDGKWLDKTDEKGIWQGKIPSGGKHKITVGKGKLFADKSTEQEFSYGSNSELKFELSKPYNAVVIIDPNPYFEAEIFFDGEKVGTGLKRITNVSEGNHSVILKHNKFPGGITKSVEINQPNQTMILKISEDNKIYVEK